MSHTLAQNWLIELFVGNASYVQNKSLSPDKARDMFLNDRLRKPYRHWNWHRKEVHKLTFGWKKLLEKRHAGSWLSRLPFREMIEPMQVRRADQALYHHELTVSSLGSDCQSCTAPLRWLFSRPKRKWTQKEVLHLYRCSTHTPRCRGAFLEDAPCCENVALQDPTADPRIKM